MSDLLIISGFPDEHFVFCANTFVYFFVNAIRRYFDTVYVISPRPYIPRILSPLGALIPKVRLRLAARDYAYDNVRVFFPRYRPWAGCLPRARALRAIYPCIRRAVERHRLRFDLIHAHLNVSGWYSAQLRKAYGVPSVLTVHDSHDYLTQWLESDDPECREALQGNDVLIRVSPFDIPEIAKVAGADKPIHYIPNGFDARFIPEAPRETLRRELGLPLDRPIFVSVARWDRRKDPLILVEALRRVIAAGRRPRPMLILVGEDRMHGQIQKAIADAGLGNDIRVTGQIPPADVFRHMRSGDATLLYSHAEGNPTVMFESLGCGRPYVGSDVGGVRAILTDPRLGLYGPPKDVDALVGLIERAIDTKWDEAFIREHARQYTWDAIARLRIWASSIVFPGWIRVSWVINPFRT